MMRIIQVILGQALGGVFILSSLSKAVSFLCLGQTTNDFLGLFWGIRYGIGVLLANIFYVARHCSCTCNANEDCYNTCATSKFVNQR